MSSEIETLWAYALAFEQPRRDRDGGWKLPPTEEAETAAAHALRFYAAWLMMSNKTCR